MKKYRFLLHICFHYELDVYFWVYLDSKNKCQTMVYLVDNCLFQYRCFIKDMLFTSAFARHTNEPRHEKICCCHMQTTKAQISLISTFIIGCLDSIVPLVSIYKFKPPASLCSWASQFESTLVGNPEDRFSRDEAQIVLEWDNVKACSNCKTIFKMRVNA